MSDFRFQFDVPAIEDVSDESNPRVFMDVSINGGPAERMIIELFANVVPKTAENFRALCTGEKGFSKTTGKPLHYKGVVFNHINKDLFVRGGDFSDGKGLTSGESIYGGYFEDENFQLLHTERGLLSMGNIGPDTNGSEFHITFVPFSLLDRFHVFGKVIQGMSTLSHINEMGIRGRGKPSGVIRITDCGQIPQDKGQTEESLKRDVFSDEHSDEREKKRRKYSPSSLLGLLEISETAEISKDKENNVIESDQDKGFPRTHPRQEVGDDSVKKLSSRQIEWFHTCIHDIAIAVGVNIPEFPDS